MPARFFFFSNKESGRPVHWQTDPPGELLGSIRTNTLFAVRHFLPDFQKIPLHKFADRFAYELVNNPFWWGENVGPSRGIEPPKCELVKLPPLAGSERPVRSTTRFRGYPASKYCPICSQDLASTVNTSSVRGSAAARGGRGGTVVFYGICGDVTRGC